MDWQQVTALGIVAATASVLGISWIRRRRLPPTAGTGGGCGCGCLGSRSPRPADAIVYRARKGSRPEIRIRPAGR